MLSFFTELLLLDVRAPMTTLPSCILAVSCLIIGPLGKYPQVFVDGGGWNPHNIPTIKINQQSNKLCYHGVISIFHIFNSKSYQENHTSFSALQRPSVQCAIVHLSQWQKSVQILANIRFYTRTALSAEKMKVVQIFPDQRPPERACYHFNWTTPLNWGIYTSAPT